MTAEEYIAKYRERSGEPSDNVIQFYQTIEQYDRLRDRLEALDAGIEREQERRAIQALELERLKGVRIFRRASGQ